jgi:hypothetical protein
MSNIFTRIAAKNVKDILRRSLAKCLILLRSKPAGCGYSASICTYLHPIARVCKAGGATVILGILLSYPATAQAIEVYVLDIEAKNVSVSKACVGALFSYLCHEFGHVLAAQATGTEYDYSWRQPGKATTYPETDHQGQMTARGGFVLQLGVGLLLRHCRPESSFTLGYSAFTAFETISYPVRFHKSGEGDLHQLRKYGGNGTLEYAIYSGIALYNLIRIEW